ncbi:hypothetical protein [Geobacter sp. OR-1]|uniref:hypothetical protein n=1 Tax=Geobacter sp. OR-1 TaxID=1266765 RepID=UPI001ED9AA32|nr:hypothetical protein [Geobacter sp. OR-1]
MSRGDGEERPLGITLLSGLYLFFFWYPLQRTATRFLSWAASIPAFRLKLSWWQIV